MDFTAVQYSNIGLSNTIDWSNSVSHNVHIPEILIQSPFDDQPVVFMRYGLAVRNSSLTAVNVPLSSDICSVKALYDDFRG